jgi:hypothetical protein
MAAADFHALIRDAVVKAVGTLDLGAPVKPLDDLAVSLKNVVDLPVIGVAPVAPVEDVPAWTTNRQSGRGYSLLVGLFAAGVVNASKTTGLPEVTAFQVALWNAFDWQRLADVSQVAYCRVRSEGRLFDQNLPAFQELTTAVIVTAYGRFPRS